jgi:protein O-mannosyl-transferase
MPENQKRIPALPLAANTKVVAVAVDRINLRIFFSKILFRRKCFSETEFIMSKKNKQKSLKIKPGAKDRPTIQPSGKTSQRVSINKPGLWMAAVMAGIIILSIYFRTFSFQLSYFDDDAILLRNANRIDSLNIVDAFTRDAEFGNSIELYRPLQNLSFITDNAIWSFNPGRFHIINVMLHLLNTLLLFLILSRVKLKQWLLLVFIAIFAAHPIFSTAVCWLPARGDLLLAFWGLLAWYLFVLYLENHQKKWLILHLLSIVFALFSKESAIVLPVLFLFYMLFVSKEKPKMHYYLYSTILLIPFFTLYFVLRSSAIVNVSEGSFGIKAIISNLAVLPETIWYFIIPYKVPVMPFYQLFYALAGTILLIVIAAAIYFVKAGNRILVFGFVWFLALTAPAMLYSPVWSDYCYDFSLHRSYLPLAGIIIGTAAIFSEMKSNNIKWVLISGGIISLVFWFASYRFVPVYADSASFFKYAVATNEKSAFAQQYLGNAEYRASNYDIALESYNKAIELKPDFADAWLNRGILHTKMNQHQEAITDFSKTIEIEPGNIQAIELMAKNYSAMGSFIKAAESYDKLIKLGKSSDEIMYSKAYGYYQGNDFADAQIALDQTLLLHPDMLPALKLDAHINHLMGRYEIAVEQYKKVLNIDNNAVDLANLAYVYFDMKNEAEAEKYFLQSLKTEPGNSDALIGMALIYSDKNNFTEAKQSLIKAGKQEPLVLKGVSGITEMENKGYSFTAYQKRCLGRLFLNCNIRE